jgi:hypothetical protein
MTAKSSRSHVDRALGLREIFAVGGYSNQPPSSPPLRRQIEEYDAGTSVGLGTVICWDAGRAAQLKQMS